MEAFKYHDALSDVLWRLYRALPPGASLQVPSAKVYVALTTLQRSTFMKQYTDELQYGHKENARDLESETDALRQRVDELEMENEIMGRWIEQLNPASESSDDWLIIDKNDR